MWKELDLIFLRLEFFLPTAELVSALKPNQDPYERIPLGKKEDKYFAISNESNFSRRKSNKKKPFLG